MKKIVAMFAVYISELNRAIVFLSARNASARFSSETCGGASKSTSHPQTMMCASDVVYIYLSYLLIARVATTRQLKSGAPASSTIPEKQINTFLPFVLQFRQHDRPLVCIPLPTVVSLFTSISVFLHCGSRSYFCFLASPISGIDAM